MFFHDKGLQYKAEPAGSDPVYAKQLQEVLGGQFGEISVMMQYLLQGWNVRMPGKYKDLVMDVATEEIGHVEMLSVMISKLLEGAPSDVQESAMKANPGVAAVMSGMNPQHAIVSGLGATFKDSNGVPWNTGYIIASGNLLADFRANVNAESQGRLQVARLYGMTDDPGVRDMLSFMLARDTMHQNMWLAAIEQLKEDGLEDDPVPSDFPLAAEQRDAAYQMLNFSKGEESREGRWASGPTPDGQGEFTYVADPRPATGEPTPPKPAKHLYVTGNLRGMASGLVDKVKAKL
jgi:Mn-containing catalase